MNSDGNVVVSGIRFSEIELACLMYPIFLETQDGAWPYRCIHSDDYLFFPEFRNDLLKIYNQLEPSMTQLIIKENKHYSSYNDRKRISKAVLDLLKNYSKDVNRYFFRNIFCVYVSMIALSYVRIHCINHGVHLTRYRDYFEIFRHYAYGYRALDFIYVTSLYLQFSNNPNEDELLKHIVKFFSDSAYLVGRDPVDFCLKNGAIFYSYKESSHDIFKFLFGIEVDIIHDTEEFSYKKIESPQVC